MSSAAPKKDEESELRRLSRLYDALRLINRTIVRVGTREELFREVCRDVVEQGGFLMSWIGWEDRPTRQLLPVATAGDRNNYAQGIVVYTDERPEGRGPAGTAFREGRVYICNDVDTDPAMAPWRAGARQNGYRSLAVFPIRLRGTVAGTLAVYAAEAGFFQNREIALLEEAARDVSFALDQFALEQARREADAAAQQEKYFSDSMIESMPGVVYLYDASGRFLRWNRNFEIVSGYSAEELTRIHPTDFFAAAEKDLVRERIAHVFEHGDGFVEATFISKDGRGTPYFFTGRRLIYDGRPCVVGMGIDMTPRREAERALRQSEERYRTTLDGILEGCQLLSHDWRYVYLNDTAAKHNRRPNSELLGNTMPEMWPGITETPVFRMFARCMVERIALHDEVDFTFPDGTKGWFDVRCQPVPEGIFILSIDISDRKKLEEQVLRTQRMEAIGALAGGVAHDLNNILAPVLMVAGLLKARRPSPKDQQALTLVESSARRGAAIIRQLLMFSRGVAGERVIVQLRHLIKEMTSLMEETFPREITLSSFVPTDLWPVLGDATQLHQVLMNLCVNARDAMPKGGELRVEAGNQELREAECGLHPDAKPGRYAVITVMDTGHGIPPAIINRIFEPFFTTKEVGKGTGLGLSTVLGIVRSHAGFVVVRSEGGKGTTFQVFLPAAAASVEPEVPAVTHLPRGRDELVLVVDDEPPIGTASRLALEEHRYRVLTAANGQQALEIFLQHQDAIRLVLTDMMMPVMNGVSLIRALRSVRPSIKILVMTGSSQEDGRSELEELGISEVLAKPCSPEYLLVAVRRKLDEV